MQLRKEYNRLLAPLLKEVAVDFRDDIISLRSGDRTFDLRIADHGDFPSAGKFIPLIGSDLLYTMPQKVAALIRSQLRLNRTVYARNCSLMSIGKTAAEKFYDSFHILNAGGGASHYGLFYRQELVMAASFSKGRKMRRLPEAQRSFELIRVCSLPGITVVGGLSRILRHFTTEKDPGDIMTYVDRQLSEGRSFLGLGFEIRAVTEPIRHLIDMKTNLRVAFDESLLREHPRRFKEIKNSGNLKLVLKGGYR